MNQFIIARPLPTAILKLWTHTCIINYRHNPVINDLVELHFKHHNFCSLFSAITQHSHEKSHWMLCWMNHNFQVGWQKSLQHFTALTKGESLASLVFCKKKQKKNTAGRWIGRDVCQRAALGSRNGEKCFTKCLFHNWHFHTDWSWL